MCQVVFTLSDENKHVEQPPRYKSRAFLYLRFSGEGEWQRTGVIGSSLSPQTGRTFHHRGISFQFSKPRHTSDAINKVFFPQTRGGKMQVSSYLIIPLIALRREKELRGREKTR